MRMIHWWLQSRGCSLKDDPVFFSSTYEAVINLNSGDCWRLGMQRSGDGGGCGQLGFVLGFFWVVLKTLFWAALPFSFGVHFCCL